MRLFTFILSLFVFLVIGFALCATSAQPGDADKIVMRDAKEVSGRLNSVNEETVKFSGKSYDRAQVKLIRLSGATNSVPEAAAADLLIMRDGRSAAGHISRVTDKLVFQNGRQLKRTEIAVIKFAEKKNIITVFREPTPGASPSASPSPTPGTAPAEGSSPEPNKDRNTSSNTNGPPWFNLTGCQWSAIPYVFVDGSLIEVGGKTRCRMWLNVCGDVIEKEKIVDSRDHCWSAEKISRPEICCDIWNKYANNPDSQWNPKKDADGDGIVNDQDDDPLGPRRPK